MIKNAIWLSLVASALIGCNMGETIEMQGRLVYSGGGKSIMVLDLSIPGSDPKTIYQGSASVSVINRITKVNDNVFLFDECPVTEGCTIKKYNIKTGHERSLCSGQLPTYVPDHDKLFFYGAFDGDRLWLLSSCLEKTDVIEKIAVSPDSRILNNGISQSVTTPAVSISSNELIFSGRNNQLWIYRISVSQCIPTDITNCSPIVWRSKTNQLLCKEWDAGKPFLLDVNTKKKEELPDLVGGYGYLYIPEYDSLIYGRARFRFPAGEGYDIFVYSFEDKKEVRIKTNVHIKSGIWIK